MKQLKGVFVPVMTPFNKNESINEGSLRNLVKFLIKSGVHGFIPTGSTGEFPHLNINERKKIWEIIFDETKNKILVVPCVTANTTAETVELAKFAEQNDAAGVMVCSPYYYIPTERELYEHLKTLAKSVEIPIMLYNSSSTKVDLKPELVASLAKIANISYIKEGTSLERIHKIIRLTNGKIAVFCAGSGFIIEAIRVGAKGWVTALQNFVPAECVRLFEAAERGDFAEAKKIFERSISPIWNLISTSKQGEQLAKAAANYIGLQVGEMRKPLRYPEEGEIAAMEKILDSLKPDYI
jgi:4-hydroxy-tetrahydrodipicolinate synthase